MTSQYNLKIRKTSIFISCLYSVVQRNSQRRIFVIFVMSRPAGADTPAVARTEVELRAAILDQTARVRRLKVKPEIEEATRELVSLKEEFKTVTGREWSDLREEGPILLTTNKVRGREILPEFKERIKQLKKDNFIR